MTIKATFIKETNVRGEIKDRWQCPFCFENHKINAGYECRFNLSKKKRGTIFNCRYCKKELLLKK